MKKRTIITSLAIFGILAGGASLAQAYNGHGMGYGMNGGHSMEYGYNHERGYHRSGDGHHGGGSGRGHHFYADGEQQLSEK